MSNDTKIQISTTETFVPNVPTRVLSMLGIVASEIPAVPVNAAGATVDHIKTSPSIKAANARISAAGGATINGTTSVVSGIGRFAKKGLDKAMSDDAKAQRLIAADKAKSLLSSAGHKLAEITPVKVVIDGAKELADDAVQTWNETGQEQAITTTETVVLDELTTGELYNVYNPHLFCERKGQMVCGTDPKCHMDTPDCDRCNNMEPICCEICRLESECEARALQLQYLQRFGQSEYEAPEPGCDLINETRSQQ